MTQQRKAFQKRKKKSKLSKSRQNHNLPNFIYPFGQFKSSGQLRKQDKCSPQTKVQTPQKLNKGYLNEGEDLSAHKANESLAKLANMKLKLCDQPALEMAKSNFKTSHCMVLRSKAPEINHLNSNQSARSLYNSGASQVYKSSCPALQSTRFSRLRPRIAGSKTWHETKNLHRQTKKSGQLGWSKTFMSQKQAAKDFKVPALCQKGNFKIPRNASFKTKRMLMSSNVQTCVSKNWNRLSHELSSRHERYVRRLQRLEAKISEMTTNSNPSDWADQHKIDYCTLSARHLRYLRRLRRVDAALRANSIASGDQCPLQQHSPHSSSSLSCGSIQMLYKKRDTYGRAERNLSLPLNLRDLDGPQVAKKYEAKFQTAALNKLQRKRMHCKSGKIGSTNHYYLRKKRGKHPGNVLDLSLKFCWTFISLFFWQLESIQNTWFKNKLHWQNSFWLVLCDTWQLSGKEKNYYLNSYDCVFWDLWHSFVGCFLVS